MKSGAVEGRWVREVRLAGRPEGRLKPRDFAIESAWLPDPRRGEARVRNLWMSVDPELRLRMGEQAGPRRSLRLGETLDGRAVGVVEHAVDSWLEPGDLVLSDLGWREAFNRPATSLELVDPKAFPVEAHLGVAGLPGLLAYTAVTGILDVEPGQTVFVSSISGAVGMAACQIARLRGARVIGSVAPAQLKAGMAHRFGVDHLVDNESPELVDRLREAAPDGIDAGFDHMGGPMLDAVLGLARPRARFALLGTNSRFIGGSAGVAPASLRLQDVVEKRLTLKGFTAEDCRDFKPRFREEMKDWVRSGAVVWQQSVVQGLDQAPEAFIRLFDGLNLGTTLVRLGGIP